MSHRLVFFTSESHFFLQSFSVFSLTLIGSLKRENEQIFKDCVRQILASDAKWIILNFRDVDGSFDAPYVSWLGDLLSEIRKKSAAAKISGLHPELRKALVDRKLVNSDELTNNLAEALDSIPSAMPFAA